MTAPGRIKVLVVDDSKAVRHAFDRLLAAEKDIEVMGLAADPYEAVELMRRVAPDVIILDVVMPRMDGLTFLSKIMQQHPLPVIVCSEQVGPDSGQAVLALERGAVEVIAKPRLGVDNQIESSRQQIVRVIRAAARAQLERRPKSLVEPRTAVGPAPGVAAKTRPPTGSGSGLPAPENRVVVIGASTGGTEALRVVLQSLPDDLPGIVVVQHMPAGFTAAFARRIDEICDITVAEAAGGERILPGTATIAPGNRHISVRARREAKIVLWDTDPVNRHRPSVDVLFRSAAVEYGPKALGVLLTGMGSDGAEGLAEMRAAGAETIAQDEKTSVVFGMPAAAIRRGAVEHILPLEDMAAEIVRWAEEGPLGAAG